ncbi:threonine-phosphate decarboxylase CobD [Brevibacillus migulae]|uniref:threonine-phosphate decarboxylase CobD n=1 Tax=Brevibacillus migulae TaxID=1644114 RepID=UPI00106E627C|nr:threonine-phosphate decarboxylase CobD [Brevibacillus migulae]
MTSGIERYGHGGDLVTAAELFGRAPQEMVDFSANINPLGPPPRLLETLQTALTEIVHYPDPGHRVFRKSLAEKLNVEADWLLPGNGAAECMALAILALQPKKVGVVYPCFSEYAKLASQFGAKVIAIYGKEESGYQPEMEQLHRLFVEADMIFVGSPNNPTGMLYEREQWLQMAAWTNETGTVLVADEAFLDFVPEEKQFSLLAELQRFPQVILIRSLTKMFAIPGLRLGYSIAHPAMVERMKNKQVTWSVNQLALLAGEVCLQEAEFAGNTRQWIAVERVWLQDQIRSKLEWQVWDGEANFLLVRSPANLPAVELQQLLGKKGILIRDCSQYPGLTEHHFRIAVRTREQNQRLVAELCEIARVKRAL